MEIQMTITIDEAAITKLTRMLVEHEHEVVFFKHNDDGTYTSVCECGATFDSRGGEARHRAEEILKGLSD